MSTFPERRNYGNDVPRYDELKPVTNYSFIFYSPMKLYN